MTVLRCTAKLLKRLKQPAKPPEPDAQRNPLGEWYADIDFWHRQPFVVMLNAATGATLMLPGNAASLRRLHELAAQQFTAIAALYGLHGARVDAEVDGFAGGFVFGTTADRSLLASMNQRKVGFWMRMEHTGQSLPEAAALEWDGLFSHPSLGRNARHGTSWHTPLDLLRQRLLLSAQVIEFPSRTG